MRLNLTSYRVTDEDLVDADKKTKLALEPLLSSLNSCLTSLVATLNALVLPSPKATSFTTDASGAAYVDMKFDTTPSELWVTALAPKSGVLNSVYSSSWIPLTSGARVLFVGLAASNSYVLRVRYL